MREMEGKGERRRETKRGLRVESKYSERKRERESEFWMEYRE